MNRFGGLGSSPAQPRPLSNGPVRAVPTSGEGTSENDFSSSGGSVACPLGGVPGCRLPRPGSCWLSGRVSGSRLPSLHGHDHDVVGVASRLGAEAEAGVPSETAATPGVLTMSHYF